MSFLISRHNWRRRIAFIAVSHVYQHRKCTNIESFSTILMKNPYIPYVPFISRFALVNCEWPGPFGGWFIIIISLIFSVACPSQTQEMIPISYCNNPEWPISNIFSPNASSFSRIYFSTAARNKTEIGFQRHTQRKKRNFIRGNSTRLYFSNCSQISEIDL